MNSRLYELLRKYEHRGIGGIITDDEDDLYAEVERWFSGEAG